MKQYEYYVFDPSLPFEYNFFLTKVLQSYRFHAAKGEESPFAYLNYKDQRDILGERTRKQKIQDLVRMSFLELKSVGKTKAGDDIMGFIPLQTNGYKREKSFHKKASMYYANKSTELPKLNKSVFKALSHVHIDIGRAEWRSVVQRAYIRLKSNPENKSTKRTYNKIMNDLYESILDWNNGNIEERMNMCSVDTFGGRFHSIFSRIPKEVRRNYLSWPSTVEIDLAQSQPTILAQLLQDRIGDNEYSSFIFRGEYLYTHLGKGNKEEGRSMFNHSVFGRRIDRFFSKLFPKAAKEIHKMKYTPQHDNPSAKNYSNLCFLLQRKETSMFEQVWVDLLKERIPFIPVHDSVVVESKHYTKAQSIITNTLQKHLCNFYLNFT